MQVKRKNALDDHLSFFKFERYKSDDESLSHYLYFELRREFEYF